MHQLKKEQITSWKQQKGGYHDSYFPGAISSNCPHCTALVSFSFTHWHKALHGVAVGKTNCPSCNDTVRLILLDYDPTAQSFDEPTSLWIYPPLTTQQRLEGIDNTNDLDDKLISAYHSTINVFNTGEWNATAILIRRFLDGMIKENLGDQYVEAELENQLNALIQSNDLSRPIAKMAETVSNGMVKKFFNLEIETNKHCASLMIEFINLLVEYLYIIPMRAETLYEKSCALQGKSSAAPAAADAGANEAMIT